MSDLNMAGVLNTSVIGTSPSPSTENIGLTDPDLVAERQLTAFQGLCELRLMFTVNQSA
jgi:hypothetical protein